MSRFEIIFGDMEAYGPEVTRQERGFIWSDFRDRVMGRGCVDKRIESALMRRGSGLRIAVARFVRFGTF